MIYIKIISYNINGLRSSNKLQILDWLKIEDADIICLQEVRAQEEICKEILKGFQNYYIYYNCGIRKGYSGTIVMSKVKANQINNGFNDKEDTEGRLITLKFNDFILLNCYVPNGAFRLEYKMEYLNELLIKIKELQKENNIILCSDINIAHNEIDVNKPIIMSKSSGFLNQERKIIEDLISYGFIDSFRYLNNNKIQYTWRSYKARNKDNNYGYRYRFDYIFISNEFKNRLNKSESPDLIYSDHLPVIIDINI